MRPWNCTWQSQPEHVILPLLVCFLQSWDDIPMLSDISSGTKVLHTREGADIYRVHVGMRAAEVFCFVWKREPFQTEHSLPNAVWLHLGETACTFTPENTSQNSWSEHLACGGSSDHNHKWRFSPCMTHCYSETMGCNKVLYLMVPECQHGELWQYQVGIWCVKQSSNISQKEQLYCMGIPLMLFYLIAVICCSCEVW